MSSQVSTTWTGIPGSADRRFPYAKHGYVSHQVYETAAFSPHRKELNLPNLGTRDATANDLSDCFDYSQAAAPYTPIKTNVSADVLLHEKPSGPPDDD